MDRRNSKPFDMDSLPTVKYWLGQLTTAGVTHNFNPHSGTRAVYRGHITKFNKWLSGRKFHVRVQTVSNGKIVRENVEKSFANVERLLYHGQEKSVQDVKTILSQFLVDPCNQHLAFTTRQGIGHGIKSYFNAHGVEFFLKSGNRRRDASEVIDEPVLTLPEFYKMMTVVQLNPMMRAVMLVKLHAGLDGSTLEDRFNYDAYEEIANFCGTKNHREWDLGKCPIPIRLVRVKTGFAHTTFIDKDALEAIKDYLAWREKHHGPHDPDGPMFLTTSGKPVLGGYIAQSFSYCAKRAHVQKKLAAHKNKISAHEVRDLLKSLLLMCKCTPWAADHIIGHMPKDSYEKPAKMSPELLRAEYSKVSKLLNVFSYVEDMMKSIEDPDAVRSNEEKLEKDIEKIKKQHADTFERLRKANRRNAEFIEKRGEIAKENNKLRRENQRLDVENLELMAERVELKKKLSRLEEQNEDKKDSIEEIVKRVVDEVFKKRDGKNLPAGSPVE